jgi:hypothetical protein
MDNITVAPATTGSSIAADDIGGVLHQRVKVVIGNDGVNNGDISTSNPMPVTVVSGIELEIKNDTGNPLPISGPVNVTNFPSSQAVTGPLTDTQLRATAVPVSGSFYQATQPVSGSVSVSSIPAVTGSVSVTNFPATQAVSNLFEGPVTPGTVATKSALMGGQYNSSPLALTNGQQSALQLDSTGRLRATTTDDSFSASGTIAALNASVNLANGQNYHMYTLTVTGTWVGVLITQISVDGVNWKTINSFDPFAGYTYASILSNMTVQCPGGTDYFRVTAAGWTSGTASIAIEASNAQGITMVIQPSGASLQTTTKLNDASGNSIYLGQNTMANSLPIAIASNQTAVPISGTVSTGLTQPLTDTQLRASAVPISGAITQSGTWTVQSVPNDGGNASYSASIIGLVAANSATDIFAITGSASKTIKVTRIAFSASQTTAAQRDVVIAKRSTSNSAGTSTSPNKVPHDSSSASATATVLAYTANPTIGTLTGNIRARKVFIGTTTANSDEYILDFGTRPSQAVTLRGVNEVLAINLNGVTSAGNSCDISIEWTEQ